MKNTRLTFYAFPQPMHHHIRSTNATPSFFRNVRRRTDHIDTFTTETSCLSIGCRCDARHSLVKDCCLVGECYVRSHQPQSNKFRLLSRVGTGASWHNRAKKVGSAQANNTDATRNGGKRLKFSFPTQSRNAKPFDGLPDLSAAVLLVPEQLRYLSPHMRSAPGSMRSLLLLVLTLLLTSRGKQALSIPLVKRKRSVLPTRVALRHPPCSWDARLVSSLKKCERNVMSVACFVTAW